MSLVRRLEPLALALTALLAGAATVQIAYRFHPIAPLALAGALGGAALAFFRPMLALYLSMALIPLELISFDVGRAGLSPAEAMFVVTGAGWALRRLADGHVPYSPSPLGMPLGLLVLSLVPGIAIATDSFLVVKVLVMWAFFFLLYQMVVADGRPETVKTVLMVLAGAGAVVGAIAAVRSGGQGPELIGFGEEATGRAFGSFGHPNTLATFQALALPGALALGLRGPVALRPAGLAAFGLAFAGLALSLSRGGLLAVAGALGIMLVWPPFRRTVAVAGVVVLAFAVSGASPLGEVQQAEVVAERISSVSYSAGGTDPRFFLWRTTPQVIQDHPIVGVGMNMFPEIAPRYGLLLGRKLETYEHAHNIPLTIAAELGLFGLAALIWLSVALGRLLVAAYRRGTGLDRGLAAALAAAFVALALQGMVDYTLRSNVIVAVIFVLAGCAVVLARSAMAAPSPDSSASSTPPSS